jgi:hypothetical protein
MKLKILVIIMALSVSSFAAVTYDDQYYDRNKGNLGGGGNTDPLKLFINEVEGYLEGATGFPSVYFEPQSSAPPGAEGLLFYNDNTNVLQLYTGSDWVNVDVAGGVSLDGAYDLGNTIDVDGDAVTLTTSDTDNNVVLAIVQNEATNDNDAVTITMGTGATGNGLTIDSQASGTDIAGDNWSISQAGLLAIAGGITIQTSGELLVSARDVLFDDTYDVAWDTSRDQFIFQDNAVLGIGGAHDAAADVTIKWDGSNMLVESAAEDTGEIRFGSTNAIDVAHYANTNTSIAKFNANTATLEFNGYDIQVMDDDIAAFGDSDEFQVYYDETTTDNLIIVATNANDAVQIGDGTTNTDMKMMGATASTYALWDASADEMVFDLADLKISQGSQIEFIDVTDSLTDWTIDNATDETLLILPAETTDDQSINLGNATYTTDLRLFGKTASTVVYDASADKVLFDAYDIALGDGDILLFGDPLGTGDIKLYTSGTDFVIDGVVADTGTVAIGVTDHGLDFKLWAATDAEGILWDASDEALEFTGANITMDAASVFTPGKIVNADVVVTDAAEYDVLAANSGKVHIITDLSQNTSIDLPAEADGLYYEFWYCGGVADAHDHTIDSENDTNYLIGGVSFIDTDAGAGADEAHAGVYSDGNSNSKLTINNIAAGTVIKVRCDGTNWYVTGIVLSDTAPAFADQ